MSSSPNWTELDSLPDDINTELALWKDLAFDMPSPSDNCPDDHSTQNSDDATTPSSSQIPPLHLHAPHNVPPSIPPETYNHLIHALLSLQGSASHAYPQNRPPTYPHPIHPGPLPDYRYPWPPATAPVAGPSSFHPPTPQGASLQPSPSAAAQDPEGTEDAISTAEDKRRRNTAASARFRLKKKRNTLNLECSVANLTGRTEELEREATDLRRENAWLKEIVLLKGRNFAALNIGSQAPAPENRHDMDPKSEAESTVRHKGKGRDEESEGQR